MIPVELLGVAWMVVAVMVAHGFRPAPDRCRQMVAGPEVHAVSVESRPSWSPVELVGRRIRGLLRFSLSPSLDRYVGRTTFVAIGVALLAPPLALGVVVAAAALPKLRRRRSDRRRQAALDSAVPEAVDLMAMAVGAGLSVGAALAAIAHRLPGPLGDELRFTVEEISRGRRLADALDDLPERVGEGVRPVVSALVASDRYGVALGESLERLALDVRRQRRQRAEEAARKVPVRLLFPLVVCVLPAFALLTVVPLLGGALSDLRL